MAIYSASVVDGATAFYFLELQLTLASPKQKMYPEHDRRSSVKFPYEESVNPCSIESFLRG